MSLSPNRIPSFLSLRGLGTPEIPHVNPPSESPSQGGASWGHILAPCLCVCRAFQLRTPGPTLCAPPRRAVGQAAGSGCPQLGCGVSVFPGEAAGPLDLCQPRCPFGAAVGASLSASAHPGHLVGWPCVSGRPSASHCLVGPAPRSVAVPAAGPAWLWARRPGQSPHEFHT